MCEAEIKKELDLYKKMYYCIFNAATDAIEQTEDEIIKSILIKAQQKAEEIYIDG